MMSADVQELANFKNHLLNNEIDEAKSILARKKAVFRDTTRTARETLRNLPRDDLGTSLIPADVTVKQGENKFALRATANGDCLFNTASIVLFGHEDHAMLLRLLVAGELYFNATFYADHAAFSETSRCNPDLDKDVLFLIALTKRGELRYTVSKNRIETVKEEAFVACEKGEWSSLMHFMGLSSVTSTSVLSVYPDVSFRYRPLMHRELHRRRCPSEISSKETDQPITILWSRDGNLDPRPGAWYQPNHFVPIVFGASTNETLEESSPPKPNAGSTQKSKQQGSLFSFLKPKASATSTSSSEKFPKRTAATTGLKNETEPEAKKSTTSSKQKIMLKWKDEFPWLTITDEDDTFRCGVCCSAPEVAGNTQFVTGSKSTKKETMQKHASSNAHMRAQNAVLARQKPVRESVLAQSFAKGKKDLEERDRKDVAMKMTTAYFIAKEELPFTKFPGLIDLQTKNGLQLTSTYANDKYCAQMVSVIGDLAKEELAAEIGKKKYISVMADGATDAGGIENETVFCRFVKDGHPTNRLIGHKAVEHAHAEGLKKTISSTFEEAGVKDWSEKLLAFGADGASVNLGKKNGLAALLRKEVPHLVDFHCLPHRLELALIELQKSCKSVDTVYNILHLIWKTYHYSPKSVRELKSIADELETNVLKPTQVKGTRWLPHVSRALKVFVGRTSTTATGQYATVLMHMEDLSVNSKNADIKGRAQHVSAEMKKIHFVAFCHFLVDLFSILSRLSLQMQRSDIILPTAVSHLKETVTRVECLLQRPEPDGHLDKFKKAIETTRTFQGVVLEGSLEGQTKRGRSTTVNFESELETAVTLTSQGLRERFHILLAGTESELEASDVSNYGPKEVVRDMLIFNVDSWPTSPSDLIDYGRQEIDRLVNWFCPILERAGCTTMAIQDQWVSLKIQINSQFRKMAYSTLWETFLTKEPYKTNFKDVLHLVEMVLVLPISAAQCERAVSAQNRIKASTRATLSVSVLEDLIRLASEGPPVSEFDPTPAVDRWFSRDKSKGERPRRAHFKNDY